MLSSPLGSSAPVPASPFIPYYYQDPISVDRKLIHAVSENWTDEVQAFRDFVITRVERHVTRAAVGASLGTVYHASNIRWLRYTIKGVTRFVPVIGWGLLAYDLYNLGEDLDLY